MGNKYPDLTNNVLGGCLADKLWLIFWLKGNSVKAQVSLPRPPQGLREEVLPGLLSLRQAADKIPALGTMLHAMHCFLTLC